MFKTLTVLGAAALAAAALATPAAAQEQTSVIVRVGDLDLSKPSDAARLDMRLRAAAREVCGDADPRDLGLSALTQNCQIEAVTRAKAEVTLAMRSQTEAVSRRREGLAGQRPASLFAFGT
jgi:UrcA family protein